ncbi:hypothetical protein H2198_009084 [Neophaeococcomyces mojaviensis]|uniref:Uncharacterized protein n=1 Tax=Neophaeococcomyces mojaviensis TaxID=3383035 RepID=A0ACC2ZVH3_9EURO|nr:hypothetical protein H2198_009084 [Knufia sp. JES_112]
MRFAARSLLHPWSLLLFFSAALVHKSLADDPQPISIDFGPNFLGYDGQWSAAQIRVGNPEQYLSVFPSTTESEAWVVGPAGCDGTSTCSSLRGGLFSADQSTSWETLGLYELGYSDLSQTTDNGYYGFDNLSISDTISASNQIIAVVNDTDHWIGQLGLVVQETRFQSNIDHLPLISTLVQNESVIPSHSYGYTAGAYYKGKSVLGSLTLGGVDTSRYVANEFWFTLGQGYIPSIAINSIEVSASSQPRNWNTNPLTLLPQSQAAVFSVDSDTPFLWLPESVCDTVAQALNLTWNETTEVYAFANGSSPQNLVNAGLQFTFNLANTVGSSQTLNLKISYDAFNLQLSYPFPGLFSSYSDARVNYFPMRRANSSSQYTIGRAFLQEVYLTVDYERNVFALSQALFPESSQQPALAAISRPKDSPWPGPGGSGNSKGLSTGAKVGTAIGMIVVAIAAALLLWYFCIKRRSDRQIFDDTEKAQKAGLLSMFSKKSTRKSSISTSAAELQADKRHATEMISDSSNSRYELSAVAPAEMAAGDVAPSFFQERVNAHIPQRNDPRSPVELVQPQRRGSTSKDAVESIAERCESPTPAYSPTDVGQRNSNSISPYSPRASGNPFRSSSDQAISPVTGSGSDPGHPSNANHSRNASDSSKFLSPISPVKGRSYGNRSSRSSNTSGSLPQNSTLRNSTVRPMPTPVSLSTNVPVRSPSRDSRFRENFSEDQKPQSHATQPLQDGHDGSSESEGQPKFSWEV